MKYTLFAKRIPAFLLSAILLLALCACGQRRGDSSAVTPPGGLSINALPTGFSDGSTSSPPDDTSSEPSASPDPAAFGAYKAVLKNKAEFFNTDDGKYTDIEGFISSFYSRGASFAGILRFALVDLDSDGTPEVILWEQVNGEDYYGFEVLHDHGETVYGYQLWYRGFNQLKTDGTFSFSSSAADSGFGAVSFTESSYSVDKITYSQSCDDDGTTTYDSNGNPIISYFVDHERSTKEAFESAFSQQGEKPDAVWHDFTDDNIEAVFPDA